MNTDPSSPAAPATSEEDLLRPLAFAEGVGLPAKGLWAAFAAAISGRPFTDADVTKLRRTYGGLLVEASASPPDRYRGVRLSDEDMATRLRTGLDATATHGQFVDVLLARLPKGADGAVDWAGGDPYTRRHLAAHAAAAGRLDGLLADPEFLVHVDPSALAPALRHVTTEEGRLIRAVYRTSLHRHRRADPGVRREILAVDATRFRADALRKALAAPLALRPRWSTGSTVSFALIGAADVDFQAVAVGCITVDGRPLAVVSASDKSVRVMDLTTGTERFRMRGHREAAQFIACVMVDGTPVAVTASGERVLYVWDLATGKLRDRLKGHTGTVNDVVCAVVDGRPVAVSGASDPRGARIWDLTTGMGYRQLDTGKDYVYHVAAGAMDGSPVVVTSTYFRSRKTVRIWDPASERELDHWDDEGARIRACATLDDRAVAVLGLSGNDLLVRDLATGTDVARLVGHTDHVDAVTWFEVEGEPVVVTTARDDTIRIWDPRTGKERGRILAKVYKVACTVLDGTAVAVTTCYDAVQVWDLAAAVKGSANQQCHVKMVASVDAAVLAGTPVAVSGSSDCTVRTWDAATGEPCGEPIDLPKRVNAVAIATQDGSPQAVVTQWQEVFIHDLATRRRRIRTKLPGSWVETVSTMDFEGRPVALAAASDSAFWWDWTRGAEPVELAGPERMLFAVIGVAVAGAPLVLGATFGGVWGWDPMARTQSFVLDHEYGVVPKIACATVQGKPVLVAGGTDVTKVWDLETRSETLRWSHGSAGAVKAIACTIVGGEPVAVSASADRVVRIRRLATGEQLHQLTLPDPVCDLAAGVGGITAAMANDVVHLECDGG